MFANNQELAEEAFTQGVVGGMQFLGTVDEAPGMRWSLGDGFRG